METHKQRKIPGVNQCTAEEILATDSLASDWSEKEVLAFIAGCFDRDILLKTLLGYASNWLSTRIIAVITKTGLQPFLLEGWPENLTHDSGLQHIRSLRAPYAPVAQNTVNAMPQHGLLSVTSLGASGLQPLFELLVLPAPQRLAVQPVQVANKTVLLIIGTPKKSLADDSSHEDDMSSLDTVATAIGNQLGEVISRAKSATLPPVDERIPILPRPLATRPMAAVVVEELNSSLITRSDKLSNPIDDGWLDLLEDSTPVESKEPLPEIVVHKPAELDEQPAAPAPVLGHHQKSDENPAHTLEMFPDVLLDLNTSRQTITHGFEKFSDELSEPILVEPEVQTPEIRTEDPQLQEISSQNDFYINDDYNQPSHTLELYLVDGNLSETKTENLTSKTLSGGFVAIPRDPQPQPALESNPEVAETPKKSSVPDSRVLRRVSITPKSFETLNRPEPDIKSPENQPSPEPQPVSKTQPTPEPQPTLKPEPEPEFDLEPYLKAFPGQLLIDRYQHTGQTMPPAQEHGPLLAELVAIGPPALEIIRTFIDSSSLELRFYAVLLLEQMPVHNMLQDVVERLFDRDQQIRSLAHRIVLNARLDSNFERVVVQRLRHEIISNYEEIRVEVAAEIIGSLQDALSIPLLIEALGEHRTRIQHILQQTLMRLTFQDLSPSISEWRRWWLTAEHQPRTDWLVDALDSHNHEIRQAAFKQTQQIPGLNLNYHPDQPQKLRERAQHQLVKWFENF